MLACSEAAEKQSLQQAAWCDFTELNPEEDISNGGYTDISTFVASSACLSSA
jgi:hypothetical protein